MHRKRVGYSTRMNLWQRILMVAVVLGASATAAEKPQRAALVELFSSQGCSSCVAAEASLRTALNGELKNAVVLNWHVDTWDYLGWRDTWASRKTTERQRVYLRALKLSAAQTPQFFVNGKPLNNVNTLTERLKESRDDADIRIDLTVTQNGSEVRAEFSLARIDHEIAWPETLHAVPVLFQREDRVTPNAGDNRGTELIGTNIVRAVGTAVEASRATAHKTTFVFAIPDGVAIENLGVAVLVEDSKSMRPYASHTAVIKP